MHAFLAALLLGSDGFTVSLALGPLITRTPARRRLALAFGLCDVAATIAGFALHRRIPGGWVAGGAPALALSYGCYVLVVARSAPARLHRWPAYLLPVLLSLDNLAYGSAVPSPGAGVVPHALLVLEGEEVPSRVIEDEIGAARARADPGLHRGERRHQGAAEVDLGRRADRLGDDEEAPAVPREEEPRLRIGMEGAGSRDPRRHDQREEPEGIAGGEILQRAGEAGHRGPPAERGDRLVDRRGGEPRGEEVELRRGDEDRQVLKREGREAVEIPLVDAVADVAHEPRAPQPGRKLLRRARQRLRVVP